MPIINTLREKMGRLVVIVVGFSILAFVLTDVLSNNSSLLGRGNNPDIGEISGETISYQDFSNLVENRRQNFINQYGSAPGEFLMQNFRNQVWEQMINEFAYSTRFSNAGIAVGRAEQIDMVQGENVSPQISQSPQFQNPETGAYDAAYMRGILRNLGANQITSFQWKQFQESLNAARRQQKYENLFLKTNYVTLSEAVKEYKRQVDTVNVDYLYVPFGEINDSLVNVTDDELKTFLEEHEDEYQVEESCSIDYISFPIIPAPADSATFKAEIENIRRNLEAAQGVEQDSLIAIEATESGGGFRTYEPSGLPIDVSENLTKMKVGDILEPKLSDGIYTLHKLSGIVDGENEHVRVSHILLKTDGMDIAAKKRVRTKAQRLLRELKNGADFAELARKNSEDGSGPAGGLLGWYQKGVGDASGNRWVKPFEDIAFSARKAGLINRLLETPFGYHIMYINSPASKKRYQVATVLVEMTPSFDTQNAVYQQVNEFMSNANDQSSFGDFAAEKGYAVFSGSNIGPNANNIGRLQGAGVRQVVTWLYRDADPGDVKEFELEDEYVVAVYRDKVEKGTAELEEVRNLVEPRLRNEKKLAYVKSKLEGLNGSLSEMATAYGPEAGFYNAPALTLNSTSLPNAGGGVEAVGAAFGLTSPGERTTAIATASGVVMVELKTKSDAAEIADYTSYMTQIQQRGQSNDRLNLRQSIREAANIKDERYKYY